MIAQQNRHVQLIDNRQDRSERKFQDEFHQWVSGPHLETHRQQLHNNHQNSLMPNLSGEQTLKLNVPGSNRIQTRNSQKMGHDVSSSFQQQCQELYEEKKHLLSQLREFGHFRDSHHSNQPMINELQLLKDFKFDSKTVQTTINKSSQGELAESLMAIPKHQRKSKQHHTKQTSVGESKLFPKSCPGVPGQSISLQASVPDTLYENPVVSTNRFDDRHNSILCPPFLDQQDYKDK